MPIRRGEIYLVNLNPVIGREQARRRPVLVLSDDAINRLPLVVTVVVGTKGDNIRWIQIASPARRPAKFQELSWKRSKLPCAAVWVCSRGRARHRTTPYLQHQELDV